MRKYVNSQSNSENNSSVISGVSQDNNSKSKKKLIQQKINPKKINKKKINRKPLIGTSLLEQAKTTGNKLIEEAKKKAKEKAKEEDSIDWE